MHNNDWRFEAPKLGGIPESYSIKKLGIQAPNSWILHKRGGSGQPQLATKIDIGCLSTWVTPKDKAFLMRYLAFLQTGILQCEAPKIAKLVYNSNNYGLWYL